MTAPRRPSRRPSGRPAGASSAPRARASSHARALVRPRGGAAARDRVRALLRTVCACAVLASPALAADHAPRVHVVRPGDTLSVIAREHGVEVEELREANGLAGSLIRPGQELALPGAGEGGAAPGWTRHVTVEGETLADVAATYGRLPATLAAANGVDGSVGGPLGADLVLRVPPGDGPIVRLEEGETLLALAARTGSSPSELVRLNGFSGLSDAGPGDPVLLPAAARPAASASPDAPTASASPAPPAPPAPAIGGPAADPHDDLQRALLAGAAARLREFEPGDAGFAWPLRGPVTSRYGYRNLSVGGNTYHGGLDVAAPTGAPILAARDGVVSRTGWIGAYGWAVFVDHGDGVETRYAHMSRIDVRVGDALRRGDPVGLVGSSGASTGPHLHFEVRFGGRTADPLAHLP